jgi:IS5 family transposase
MLAALIVLYLKGLGSYRDLADFLAKDQFWARKCGFDDRTPDQSSFSRFLSSLDDRRLDMVNRVLSEELRRAGVIGDKWAMDSTFLEASAKDLEAAWGWDDINGKYVWGYKIHTIVDAESELPIQMLLSPANELDGRHAVPLLNRAVANLGFVPRFVIADKGYDSRKIREHIDFWMDSEAVIKSIQRTRVRPVYDRRFSRLYRKRTGVERFFSKLEAMNLLRRFRVFGMKTVEKLVRLIGIGFLVLALLAVHTRKKGLLRSPKRLLRSLL